MIPNDNTDPDLKFRQDSFIAYPANPKDPEYLIAVTDRSPVSVAVSVYVRDEHMYFDPYSGDLVASITYTCDGLAKFVEGSDMFFSISELLEFQAAQKLAVYVADKVIDSYEVEEHEFPELLISHKTHDREPMPLDGYKVFSVLEVLAASLAVDVHGVKDEQLKLQLMELPLTYLRKMNESAVERYLGLFMTQALNP